MSTRESFFAFAEANPHVYERLVELAREAKALGHERIGMGMLWEVLRWERIKTEEGGEYALNNNYRRLYALAIMRLEPDLRGFIRVRSGEGL